MFDMDDKKPKRQAYQLGSVLEEYSVDQLDELITDLNAELTRVKAEKDAKASSRSAADAFFKK